MIVASIKVSAPALEDCKVYETSRNAPEVLPTTASATAAAGHRRQIATPAPA